MNRETIWIYNALTYTAIVTGWITFFFLLVDAWIGIPLSLLSGIGCSLWLRGKTAKVTKHNLALKRDGKYEDIGPGSVSLGVLAILYEAVEYDPRSRRMSFGVLLPTKNVRMMDGILDFDWKPDPADLNAFFEFADFEKRLKAKVQASMELWSKQLLTQQVYQVQPEIAITVPGAIIGPLSLTDVDYDAGYEPLRGIIPIRDNTALITSAIDEIEDENYLEEVRAHLKGLYGPERHARIDRLIGNRAAVLRKRGLRENR
jgi:hypothetical protein